MNSLFLHSLMILFSLTGASKALADCNLTEMQNDPRSKLTAIKLIDITADYYGDEVFHLGYTLDAGTITSVYYENSHACRRFFSFEDLSGQVSIINHGSYELVRIHSDPGAVKGEYQVSMSYMTNGLFKNRKKINLNLRYNAQAAVYELLAPKTGRPVSLAHATTNFWGPKEVGINEIIFQ